MTDTTDAQIAEELAEELHDATDLIDRQAKLLTGVANALKGPPGELSMHDHSDLVEVAQRAARNVAAACQREAAAQRLAGVMGTLAYETLRVVAPDGGVDVHQLPALVAAALGRDPEPMVPQPKRPGVPAPAVCLGEDGRYTVAWGHLEPSAFLPLVIAANAGKNGWPELLVELLLGGQDDGRVVDLIEQRWAVERTEPVGNEDVDWDGQARPGERSVDWDGVAEDAPGAFPVTVIDLEMVG